MKIKELFDLYYDALIGVYPQPEARSCAYMLMEQLHNTIRMDIVISPNTEIDADYLQTNHTIEQIKNNVPIQYITKKCYFMEHYFHVDSGVLIPRPETEQLINLATKYSSNAKTALDIGTGSGIIAIMISQLIANISVTAYDISPKALKIAQLNNLEIANGEVNFEKIDILAINKLDKKFDLIISNPPYICENEKSLMRENVLQHEPHIALFVPNNDPLLFYRKISQLAIKAINTGGALYFEINESFAIKTQKMMQEVGFKDVEIIYDIFDKPRIIKAFKI